jgi:2-keto-3-deoxy-galactonokinase
VIGAPRLVALDWGTSMLRGYLLADHGEVIEEWGIMHVPEGDFARALSGIAEDWLERSHGLPVIAAGMIGSAQAGTRFPIAPARRVWRTSRRACWPSRRPGARGFTSFRA